MFLWRPEQDSIQKEVGIIHGGALRLLRKKMDMYNAFQGICDVKVTLLSGCFATGHTYNKLWFYAQAERCSSNHTTLLFGTMVSWIIELLNYIGNSET